MGSDTVTGTQWMIFFAFLAFYLLPWFVAGIRGSKHWPWVAIIDVFFGWTVIGWFCALALACQEHKK